MTRKFSRLANLKWKLKLRLEPLERRDVPSFLTAPLNPTESGPRGIASGDFNNDGNLDLATANNGAHSVSVLLGVKVDYAAGSFPWGITADDFNADGKMDLAVANSTPPGGTVKDAVTLLEGNGNLTFSAPTVYPLSGTPNSLVSGDFNADGFVDLASANRTSNRVATLLATGSGAFIAAHAIAAGTGRRRSGGGFQQRRQDRPGYRYSVPADGARSPRQ